MLSTPTACSALLTPRSTVEPNTFRPSARSVVAASSFRLPRNLSALGAWKTGPLTMMKFCVVPSASGRRAPGASSTFRARPRGRETESGRMSPALVDIRR